MKPAREGLIISIAIVSSLWGPLAHFCERPLKAEARGLFLIQPHAASEAPDSRTAVLSRRGRADGWRKGFVCVRVLACVCVCVPET